MSAPDAGLAAQLAVSGAQAAARTGDLDRAARLLDELEAAGAATVASLDLRARVHAQRGNMAEADACWARVQELDRNNVDAAAGRRAVARIRAGRRSRPLVTAGRTAAAATAATATVLATVLAGGISWVGAEEPTSPAVAAPDAERLAERAGELERRVAELAPLEVQQARRDAARARLARELTAVADALAMPGLRVERRAADVRVIFDDGVYLRSTRITEEGARLLAELGRRLARLPVTTTVVGHVVAVAGGKTSGGSTVALARALVAADQLTEGGLPLTAFTLVSADQTQGPFPDAARNRTVSLLVAPAS